MSHAASSEHSSEAQYSADTSKASSNETLMMTCYDFLLASGPITPTDSNTRNFPRNELGSSKTQQLEETSLECETPIHADLQPLNVDIPEDMKNYKISSRRSSLVKVVATGKSLRNMFARRISKDREAPNRQESLVEEFLAKRSALASFDIEDTEESECSPYSDGNKYVGKFASLDLENLENNFFQAKFSRSSSLSRARNANDDSEDEDRGVLKKINDVKSRLGLLKKKPGSDSKIRPSSSEASTWADGFRVLMASKYGQTLYRAFLHREFSEENAEFWLAVEDFRGTQSESKMQAKALKIHSEFIAVHSPKQVNLDTTTRQNISSHMQETVDGTLFDTAQKRIQCMMESDSYPRFLRSELYRELLSGENKPENE